MEAFATFVYANFVRYLCFHCSNVLSLTSSEVLPPGVFLRLSPFLQKGGMPLECLGMPLCASRGFSSPSARLGPAGGVEGPLVARARFCLLGSFVDWGYGSCFLAANSCYLFYVPIGSPSSSLYVRRGDGVGELSGKFFAMFSVVSPASSLHAQRGGEAGETSKCRSC